MEGKGILGKKRFPKTFRENNPEEMNRHFEYILKTTLTNIFLIDDRFNLQYVDNLWRELYGMPGGRKCYAYFHDRREPCENCKACRALKTKQTSISEQILPREGNRRVVCHTVPFQNEQGEWLVAGFKTDITKQKQLEEKLQFQLQFEKMVSSISYNFINITADQIDEMINWSLQQIGLFFGLDHAVTYQFCAVKKTMVSSHGWHAAGSKPLTGILKGMPVNKITWLFAQIQKTALVYFHDLDMMPPEAHLEQKEFIRQGLRSFLILPFFIKTDNTTPTPCFLAFYSVEEKKPWSEEQISLLNIVAGIIAGALTKLQLEEMRQQALELLKKERYLFEDILESSLAGYWDWDLVNNTEYLSPAFKRMFGYEDHELSNEPESWRSLIVKKDLPLLQNLLEQHVAGKGKEPIRCEIRFRHKDGSIVWVIGAGRVVEWMPDGFPRRMVGCHIDITKQKQTEEALEKSEARYREIVENINDAFIIHDFKGTITDLNEVVHRMLGYERNELLGANIAKICSPEEKELVHQRIKQLLKDNEQLFEGTVIHKNGSLIPIEASLKVVSYDGNGVIQGFVRDIKGRKQSEQQIANYTAELEGLYLKLDEELNRAKQVHERTLPKELPKVEGISLAAYYQPAEKLGGDFYDVVKLGKKLVIYLSDVTGHGVDGAILSVFVKHVIKGYLSFALPEDIRPEKILRYLSAQFRQKSLPAEYFICIFLAVLDLETMELIFTGAGFQDAPLVKMGGGKNLKLVSKGLFLSPAFSEELLNLQENSIYLTPGTTIFFNTDGLTEQGKGGAYYGSRLPALFYENSYFTPEFIAQIVCEDFQKFNEGSLQAWDDITFLILQRDPDHKISECLELASNFAELEYLHKKVSGLLGDSKEADLFLSCLHELVSNAIEHGNRLDQEKKVSVGLVITDRFIQGSVEDQGNGFNWQKQIAKPFDLNGKTERGRGIAMVRLCSERLFYNEKGNLATFIIKA